MKRSERDEWVRALRSGDYPQAKRALRIEVEDGKWGYCCLGVKCYLDLQAGRHGMESSESHSWTKFSVPDQVFTSERRWSDTMPTAAILSAWGMAQSTADTLAGMNDGRDGPQRTFLEIADWIEENIEPVDD